MRPRLVTAMSDPQREAAWRRLAYMAHISATALREAADDLYTDAGPSHPLSTADWLRSRADAIDPIDYDLVEQCGKTPTDANGAVFP